MKDDRINRTINCLLIAFLIVELMLLITGVWERKIWDNSIAETYGQIPEIYTFLQGKLRPILNILLYLLRGVLVVKAYYMLLRYKRDFHIFRTFIIINMGVILFHLYISYYFLPLILEHPYTIYDLSIYNMTTIMQMSVYWIVFGVIKYFLVKKSENENLQIG